MRRVTLCLLVVSTACASSGTSSIAPVKPATQTIGGGGMGSLTMSASATTDVSHLPFSADAVWRILPSVYDSIGIQVTTVDPATKKIGNPGYKIRQRLGKVPLSRYLDCGTTQIGPNADSYDVVLTVLTVVTPEGAGTGATLSTVVEAQSRPATFTQAYNRCSSKGAIEIRVAELVKARLSR